MPLVAISCHKLPSVVKSCHQLSKVAISCKKLTSVAKRIDWGRICPFLREGLYITFFRLWNMYRVNIKCGSMIWILDSGSPLIKRNQFLGQIRGESLDKTIKNMLLNFAATRHMGGWWLEGYRLCAPTKPPPTTSSDPYKLGVGGAGPQCKCRSSAHSKEPGWHHEHPHRRQARQRARQLGVCWQHPSSPFSSSLLHKPYPSQQRAKIGWQGSFQLFLNTLRNNFFELWRQGNAFGHNDFIRKITWYDFGHLPPTLFCYISRKYPFSIHHQFTGEWKISNHQVNLCSGCTRPWWCCRFPEVQWMHGLLEKVSHFIPMITRDDDNRRP